MHTMTNEEWQGPASGGTTHLQVFVNGSPGVARWGQRGPENKATNAQSKPFGTGFKVLQSPQPNLQVPFPLSDFFWNCFICKKTKHWGFYSLVLPLCALANPTRIQDPSQYLFSCETFPSAADTAVSPPTSGPPCTLCILQQS